MNVYENAFGVNFFRGPASSIDAACALVGARTWQPDSVPVTLGAEHPCLPSSVLGIPLVGDDLTTVVGYAVVG